MSEIPPQPERVLELNEAYEPTYTITASDPHIKQKIEELFAQAQRKVGDDKNALSEQKEARLALQSPEFRRHIMFDDTTEARAESHPLYPPVLGRRQRGARSPEKEENDVKLRTQARHETYWAQYFRFIALSHAAGDTAMSS